MMGGSGNGVGKNTLVSLCRKPENRAEQYNKQYVET